MSDQGIQEINVPREEMRTSSEIGMKQAQSYFKEHGFAIGPAGFLTGQFSDEQVSWLRQDREKTKKVDGNDLPTVSEFYKGLLVGVSLFPQLQDGQITNLYGRGVGVEVAIRGNVKGRVKHDLLVSYRSHSDFDLYDVDYDYDPRNLANISRDAEGYSVPPYPPEFVAVFGNQEYYPPIAMKAVKNMPKELLSDTHEVVNLGGVDILVPQLELLALDKLLQQEATPRVEGIDAEVLALFYDLDKNKMLDYYEQYVLLPKGEPSIEDVLLEGAESYLSRLARLQRNLEEDIARVSGKTRSEARQIINATTQECIDDPDKAKAEREILIARRSAIFDSMNMDRLGEVEDQETPGQKVIASSDLIQPDLWIPYGVEDVDESGRIVSQEYRTLVFEKYKAKNETEIRAKRAAPIEDFFRRIEVKRKGIFKP